MGWYVYDAERNRYLHHDGQWRYTATAVDNDLSGYFNTQAEAEAALARVTQSAKPRHSILASLLAELESNPA